MRETSRQPDSCTRVGPGGIKCVRLATLQPHPFFSRASMFSLQAWRSAASVAFALSPVAALAQTAAVQSAPISDIRYEVTFDPSTAPTRTLRVGMTFDVAGQGPVLLSLPAWTPGAYEISN